MVSSSQMIPKMSFLRILIYFELFLLVASQINSPFYTVNLDSVAEQGFADLISKLDIKNSSDVAKFDELVQQYLSDLMVQYRSKIVQLYKAHSCNDQDCSYDDYDTHHDHGTEHEEVVVASLDLYSMVKQPSKITDISFYDSTNDIYSGYFINFTVITSSHGLIQLLEYQHDEVTTRDLVRLDGHTCSKIFHGGEFLVTAPCHELEYEKFYNRELTEDAQTAGLLAHDTVIFMNTTEGKYEIYQRIDTGRISVFNIFVFNNIRYMILTSEYLRRTIIYTWTRGLFVAHQSLDIGYIKENQHVVIAHHSYLIIRDLNIFSSSKKYRLLIFKLSSKYKYEQFQVISDPNNCNVTDFTYYNSHHNHHLVFSCSHGTTYVYWWHENQFLLWQTIEDSHNPILQWTYAPLPSHEAVLYRVDKDGIWATNQDARNYISLLHPSNEIGVYWNDLNSGLTDPIQPIAVITNAKIWNQYVLITNVEQHEELTTVIYKANFADKVPKSRYQELKKETEKCIAEFNELYAEMQGRLETTKEHVSQATFSQDGHLVIHGDVEFHGSLTAHEIVADSFFTPVISDHPNILNVLFERDTFNQIMVRADFIQEKSNSIAVINGNNVINGNITIIGSLDVETTEVQELHIEYLNEFQFDTYFDIVLLKSAQNQILQRPLVEFYKSIGAEELFSKEIDGFNIEDLVPVDRNVIITSNLVFTEDVSVHSDVVIDNLLTSDLLMVSEDEFGQPMQTINADVIFENHLTVEDVGLHGYYNGIDVEKFSENIIKVSANNDQIITGNFTFVSSISVQNLSVPQGFITPNLNINSLFQDAVTLDEDHRLQGDFTFKTLDTTGPLIVIRPVNQDIVIQDLLTKSTDQVIRADNVVIPTTDIVEVEHDVTVFDRINGVRFPEDVVLTSEDYTFNDTVTFTKPLSFFGNISFGSDKIFVNGYDIQHKYSQFLAQSSSTSNSLKVDGSENITIESLDPEFINNVNITRLLTILLTRSSNQKISGSYKFGNLQLRGPVSLNGLVNGRNINEDFVRSSLEEQTITSKIKFHDNVIVANVFSVPGTTINNVDLLRLNSTTVKKSTNQVIRGIKTFVFATSCASMRTSHINGINTEEDLIHIRNEQNIQKLVNLNGGTLECDRIHVEQSLEAGTYVNGREFRSFVANTVRTDDPSTVISPVGFNSLEVTGSLALTKLLQYDIDRLYNKALTKNTDQQVTGNVVFKTELDINQLTVTTSVNGRTDFNAFCENILLMPQNRSVPLVEIMSFRSLKIYGDIQIDYLGGINLKDCLHSTVYLVGDQILTGSAKTVAQLHIHDLNISGTVNGVFIKDILKTDEDYTLEHSIIFKKHVYFNSIYVNGNIGGVNIIHLDDTAIRLNAGGLVAGQKTFSNLTISNAILRGTINGHNLDDIANYYVSKMNDQVIPYDVIINSPVKIEQLFVEKINNVNMTKMLLSAIRKDVRNQIITGSKIFKGIITAATNDITIVNDLRDVNFIDYVEIQPLIKSILTPNNDFDIDRIVYFHNQVSFSDIQLQGILNGIDHVNVNTLLLTHSEQTISGYSHFTSSIEAYSIVTRDGLVTGLNISHLIQNSIRLSSAYSLPPLHISSEVHITGDLNFDGLINGENLNSFVRTNWPNQEMYGNVIFSNPEVNIMDGNDWTCINGYQMSEVMTAYRSIGYYSTNSSMSFTGNSLIQGSVYVMDKVNSVSVKDIVDQSNIVIQNGYKTIQEEPVLQNLGQQCLNQQRDVAKDLMKFIPYFENFEQLSLSAQHIYTYNNQHANGADVTSLILTLRHNQATGSVCDNLAIVTCNVSECFVDNSVTLPKVFNTTKVKTRLYESTKISVFMNSGPATSECYGDLYPDLIGTEFTVVVIEDMKTGESRTLTVSTESACDIEIFQTFDGSIILIIVNFNQYTEADTVIYDIKLQTEGGWSIVELQRLPIRGSKSGTVFSVDNSIYLVLLSSFGISTFSTSKIYLWDGSQFQAQLHFRTQRAYDTETFKSAGETLLIIASNSEFKSEQFIHLYRFNKSPIRVDLVQTLYVGSVDVEVFSAYDDIFMTSVSESNNMTIYRWEGFFKFQEFQSIPITGPKNVFMFELKSDHYIAVAGAAPDDNSGSARNTKIFKSVVKGYRPN